MSQSNPADQDTINIYKQQQGVRWLYLLAELKTISPKISTIFNMKRPPADFRYGIEPPQIIFRK